MWKTNGFKPPVLLLVTLISMSAAHLGLPLASWLPLPWRFAGLGSVLAGVALNIVADRLFKARGSVSACRGPDLLVTVGPYAFSRNPMYLGFALILSGVAVLLGTVGPMLPAAGFVPLAHLLYVRHEEALLAERHGDAWLAYATRVRRWI
jgi:protein-S-isoprenylcysteine O-methyltransferase Ste14